MCGLWVEGVGTLPSLGVVKGAWAGNVLALLVFLSLSMLLCKQCSQLLLPSRWSLAQPPLSLQRLGSRCGSLLLFNGVFEDVWALTMVELFASLLLLSLSLISTCWEWLLLLPLSVSFLSLLPLSLSWLVLLRRPCRCSISPLN